MDFVLRMHWMINTDIFAIRHCMFLWVVKMFKRMTGIVFINLLSVRQHMFLGLEFVMFRVTRIIFADLPSGSGVFLGLLILLLRVLVAPCEVDVRDNEGKMEMVIRVFGMIRVNLFASRKGVLPRVVEMVMRMLRMVDGDVLPV